MGDEKPEKGDTVSWNWGGGAPGGTVAETKDQGAIEIKSKRGNTIKKKADPEDPAVHIERSGNDVVKRASELTVEQKNPGKGNKEGEDRGEKRKAKDQDPEVVEDEVDDDEANEGGDDPNGDDIKSDRKKNEPHTKNKQGKEVKKGGKEANKKQKMEQDKKEVDGVDDEGDDDEVATDDDVVEIVNPVKDVKKVENKKEPTKTARSNSTHKASGGLKKDAAPRQQGDQISTRTRTHVKA
ncbi:hypothetical protein F4818DRAFT_434060 [Hypoxylon cercidicola]|nr:hypothetical protein F4818DRAFT_434060 [Hypoxylon cercidicola]